VLDVVFNSTSMKGCYEERGDGGEWPGASNGSGQSCDLLRLRIPFEKALCVMRVEKPVSTAMSVMLVPVERPEALPISALLVEDMLVSEPLEGVRGEES
jgi:hypothetical protein